MRALAIAAAGATVLTVGALLAGCGSTVPGTPETSSTEFTEPTVPTPRPSVSSPTSTTTLSPEPSTPTAAPPGGTLPAKNGYVYIETKSGQTRCQINAQMAGCEAQFTNSPEVDGGQANGVTVDADGKSQWILGNLGDIPVVTLDYRTYSAVGWTIDATEAGTRFTNDATGHGMFVAIEKVDFF
jgi:hypothetical protein